MLFNVIICKNWSETVNIGPVGGIVFISPLLYQNKNICQDVGGVTQYRHKAVLFFLKTSETLENTVFDGKFSS